MQIPWAQTIMGTIALKLQAVYIYILLLWEISKSTQRVPLEDFLEYYYPVPTQ